jgi:hypothetical protein
VLAAKTGTYTLNVAFKPTVNQHYSETLNIDCESGTCPVPMRIKLDGKTVEAAKVRVYIPSFDQVEPTEKNFEIPIFARLSDPNASITGLGFKAVVEYNATVFFAEKVLNGQITADSIFEKKHITTITADGVNLNQNDSLLTTLVGFTMLGETDTTVLKLSSFEWTAQKERISLTETDSGKLVISICRANGPRLINNPNVTNTVIVSPNPAGKKVAVHATCLEYGLYRFELVDMSGRAVSEYRHEVGSDADRVIDFDIDASEMSSGMYYLIMRTPARVKTVQVYILK